MIWATLTLGDIAQTVRNGIFARRPNDDALGSSILRISSVRDGRVNLDDRRFVEGLDTDRIERFRIWPGNLLMTRYNGSRSLVGISGIVPEHDGNVVHPDKLIRVALDTSRVDPRFINYQLQAPRARAHLEPRIRTTAGQSGIAGADVRSIPVVVPPLDEQRRIVDLLEDQLSRLDAASRAVADSLVRLKTLRDSALLSVVDEVNRTGKSKAHSLGELARVSSGMTPLRGNKAFYDGGTIPWITSGDLHQGLITKPTQFVTQRALDETHLKFIPAGSLLVAMYGEGKTRGTAAELGLDATTNQACAAITLHEPNLRAWVHLILDANYSGLRRLAAGGVQPNLNLSLIKATEVPVPSSETRRMLISRVARIDEAQERMRKELLSAQRRGASLRRSLLKDAFSGRLTGAASDLSAAEEMIGP